MGSVGERFWNILSWKYENLPVFADTLLPIFTDTPINKMMHKPLFLIILAWLTLTASAQTELKKVYDESVNPLVQIEQAVDKARSENKFVVCQVGGNWCPWCLRFADFISNDSTISKVIDDSFVYIHVNYNPRRADQASVEQGKAVMERLANPARFGFPVFVILDENGKVLHTQDSSFLEEGKSYDKDKVLRFFRCWTPAACGR